MALQSQEARDQFTADPRNVGFKVSLPFSKLRRPHELTQSVAQEQIVGLVADVVVYDFEDNDWGY